MSIVTCDITVSADGYVAGPRQSLGNPIGEGGDRLHRWIFGPLPQDQQIIDDWQHSTGAYVMGRNMFGPGRGEWDPEWTGWWGPEPPFGVPVFVLTHHGRDPLQVGATTFHFVTDGVESAVRQARSSAGERSVSVAGGASTANQALAAGLVDQLHVHTTAVVFGGPGERLFEGVPRVELEPVQVVGSPDVTHVKYAVRRP